MFSFFRSFFSGNNQIIEVSPSILSLIKKYKCDNEPPTKNNLERLIRRIASEGAADHLQQLLSSHVITELPIDIDARNQNGLTALGYIESGLKRARFSGHEQCKRIVFEYKNTQFQKHVVTMTVDAIRQFLSQAIKEGNWLGVKMICDLPVAANKPTNLYNAMH